MEKKIKVTMRIYEKFLKTFDFKIPNEEYALSKIETGEIDELVAMVKPGVLSQTMKLIVIQKLTNQVIEDLKTVDKMRQGLTIPECENPLPKITYSVKSKFDELITIRNVKTVFESAGFVDEYGKSEYFDCPLTTLYHVYYKKISNT